MYEITGKFTKALVTIDSVEDTCVSQIVKMVNHPAFRNPIAIMPDTHAGKGSVIGFTMPMGDKVIPNIIGVDIGCGMLSAKLKNKELPDLSYMDEKIRKIIPMGQSINQKDKSKFDFRPLNYALRELVMHYNENNNTNYKPTIVDEKYLKETCKKVGCNFNRFTNSVGTLGGGNHFIELGIDEDENYWVTLHTGSRNFGKCVCEYHQRIAEAKLKSTNKIDIEAIKKKFKNNDIQKEIIRQKAVFAKNGTAYDKELAYLVGEDAYNYMVDMIVAQFYAEANRRKIMDEIIEGFNLEVDYEIETVHNYINFEDGIIRKGAVSAKEGELFILPFNMRDGLIIAKGKGNADWNYSAPHGAGRILPRGRAKRELSLDEFNEQMKDIYSTSVCASTLDEAPNAYKDKDLILEAIKPTADIVCFIKPVLNLKSTQ